VLNSGEGRVTQVTPTSSNLSKQAVVKGRSTHRKKNQFDDKKGDLKSDGQTADDVLCHMPGIKSSLTQKNTESMKLVEPENKHHFNLPNCVTNNSDKSHTERADENSENDTSESVGSNTKVSNEAADRFIAGLLATFREAKEKKRETFRF